MWHQNLEAGESAGSSVGPIVGGVIAVTFHCFYGFSLFSLFSSSFGHVIMILSGNRPGSESSGWGFSLDEEEKVSGRHLHEQGKSFPCLTLVFSMFLIQLRESDDRSQANAFIEEAEVWERVQF